MDVLIRAWETGILSLAEPLLQTKITVPEKPSGWIPRTELIQMLAENIPGHRLSLVSAQAGYGKTTLLADWARQSNYQVAWLSLDEEDDQFETFLRYLAAAWQSIDPSVHQSELGILLGSIEVDRDKVRTTLLNQVNQLTDHLIFVLDDFHLISDEAIHQMMRFWLGHLPASAHFVLSTRTEPPLPLHRYRAKNQLFELGPEQLRFNQVETAEFFDARMDSDLSAAELEGVSDKLEGWVGGLQLVALGSRIPSYQGEALSAVGGSQRYLAEYLTKDVLERQSVETQEFLLKTSILERFTADLCDAVVGWDASRRLIAELEAKNLFIQPLDQEGQWYRYHKLFSDFLRGQLAQNESEQAPALHKRAAHWFQQREMAEQAIHHALASREQEVVLLVCDRFLPLKISRGELNKVQAWLNEMPDDWFNQNPMLVLGRAAYHAVRGDFEAAMKDLEFAESQLRGMEGEQAIKAKARLTAFYCSTACMQNDLEQAQIFGQRAARELPPNDVFYHGMIHGSMGDAYRSGGEWQLAREHYLKALHYSKNTPFEFAGIHAYGGLADMCLRQGKLAEAADNWQQALGLSQEPESWGAVSLPVIGWAYVRLAEIKYEWNHLEAAGDDLEAGLERARLGDDIRTIIAGNLLRGQLALARGEYDKAEHAIEDAAAYLRSAQLPEWSSRFERLKLDCWLAQKDLPSANHWVKSNYQSEEIHLRQGIGPVELGVVRVLLAKRSQKDTSAAMSILEEVERTAQDQGRVDLQLQSMALKSIASWQSHKEADAMTCLDQALRLGQPEGYLRTYLDLGMPMARLLQEAAARQLQPDRVSGLLEAFKDQMDQAVVGSPLPEPLTDRELDVLGLMAAGLTNKEIAKQLIISPGTVKKHAANIYGKLGVSGRTAAASRARELALLD